MINRRPKCRLPASVHTREGFPTLSVIMLLFANMAFGFFLRDNSFHEAAWVFAIIYVILECSALSIAWKPARDLVLLGFQSDVGYTCMALAIASFAVVVVAWIQVSTYFLMMLCAAILLRVKLYTRRGGAISSFAIMLSASLAGLAISWVFPLVSSFQLPSLLQSSS